jgi:hypothetical protein
MRALGVGTAILVAGCSGSLPTPVDGGHYAYPPLDAGPLVAAPVLDAVSPSSIEAGSPATALMLTGTAFAPGCIVLVDGAARAAQLTGSTALALTLSADELAVPRALSLTVVNPGPGGGPSGPKVFNVTGASPIPRLDGIAPAAVNAGSGALVLTLNGGNFSPRSKVQVNGADRATTFVSTVKLTAAVLAADVASAGSVSVTVTTPAPGGGTSAAQGLTVQGTASGLLRVSLAEDGGELGSNCDTFAVSPEGRFVAFTTSDPGVVSGDTNGRSDIFVRDTCLDVASGCAPSTVRVSLGADGGQLARGADLLGLSAQGRFVLMQSDDPGLVDEPFPAGDVTVVLRDTCRGASACTPSNVAIYRRVDGGLGSGTEPYDATLSADGRFVAFVHDLPDLVSDDTNGSIDAFVRDTCIGAGGSCVPSTQRVSLAPDGGERRSNASRPALSNDGRFVAFISLDPVTDDDLSSGNDLFVRDTCQGAVGCTPTTVKASYGPAGELVNGSSLITPALSGDGRWASFTLRSTLGFPDTNNAYDVFSRDTCLGASAACSPSTQLISAALDGGTTGAAGSLMYAPGTVSQTGRYQAFLSSANDLAIDDLAHDDIFVRDTCAGVSGACTPATRQVSRAPQGPPPDQGVASRGPAMTPDGRWVVFSSDATNLVSGDTNGRRDVFIVAPGF